MVVIDTENVNKIRHAWLGFLLLGFSFGFVSLFMLQSSDKLRLPDVFRDHLGPLRLSAEGQGKPRHCLLDCLHLTYIMIGGIHIRKDGRLAHKDLLYTVVADLVHKF